MKAGDWILPAGSITAHLVENFPVVRESELPKVAVKCNRIFFSEYCKVVDLRTVGARVCGRCEKFSVKKG